MLNRKESIRFGLKINKINWSWRTSRLRPLYSYFINRFQWYLKSRRSSCLNGLSSEYFYYKEREIKQYVIFILIFCIFHKLKAEFCVSNFVNQKKFSSKIGSRSVNNRDRISRSQCYFDLQSVPRWQTDSLMKMLSVGLARLAECTLSNEHDFVVMINKVIAHWYSQTDLGLFLTQQEIRFLD